MNWDVGSSDCGSLAQHCLCWPSHSLATVRSRDSLTPLLQSICMNCTGNTSGIAVKRRATALNVELVGIGPMCEGRHVASMSKFLAQINEPQRWLRPLSKKCTLSSIDRWM